MAIGIDDDFIDDEFIEDELESSFQDNQEDYAPEQSGDFIDSLLKDRGIDDKSRIKFENENGETEEFNWDELDNETKLNILNSSVVDDNTNLDEDEIQLINTIRTSKLTPREYIQYVQQHTLNNYLQTNNQITYKVDELSDDELYVTDLIARTNITEQEAFEALDRAKTNEQLFKKQVDAIRTEYQNSEQENLRYAEFQKQEEAQQRFNQFAEGIRYHISDFTEFAGCDLNMNNEDMQELYEFITGFDTAGNSHFGKALNDPYTLVRMAWFALNGEKMIQDINDYYKREITNVRKESYNKGLSANKPSIVHKQQKNNSNRHEFDDLDNF